MALVKAGVCGTTWPAAASFRRTSHTMLFACRAMLASWNEDDPLKCFIDAVQRFRRRHASGLLQLHIVGDYQGVSIAVVRDLFT
ncbi:MAG: hypothetical protein AMXMBFR61_17660 [Fimbriimonadales bacterium]